MHRSANGCVLCMQHARHGPVIRRVQRRASGVKISIALMSKFDKPRDLGNASAVRLTPALL
jgi:hypothetical protein